MPILVEITDSSSYGRFLDGLIGRVGEQATEEVTLVHRGEPSAKFRIDLRDLYVDAFWNGRTNAWVTLRALNYNHMASPDKISSQVIHNAVVSSAQWVNVSGAAAERQLKVMILIISEAARFMLVRFAVNRVCFRDGVELDYADLLPVIRNWSAIRERAGHAQITVADVRVHMPACDPTWMASGVRASLIENHLLF